MLVASAAAMLLIAALIWTGVIAVADEGRVLAMGALVAAGMVDVFLGVRFIQASD
jgi:hypothetical protein